MRVPCPICHRAFDTFPAWQKRGSGLTCSYACGVKLRGDKTSGSRNGKYKGGRWKRDYGYIAVATGKRSYRLEHDLIVERIIGRRLRRGENVHHINGVKDDNREDNLLLLSVGEHAALHARRKRHNRN